MGLVETLSLVIVEYRRAIRERSSNAKRINMMERCLPHKQDCDTSITSPALPKLSARIQITNIDSTMKDPKPSQDSLCTFF